eukprot:scaffold163162_cov26-Tisochrysis_lutea.AAC.2
MSRPVSSYMVALKPLNVAGSGPALLSSTKTCTTIVSVVGSASDALMMVIVVASTNMLTMSGVMTSSTIGTMMMMARRMSAQQPRKPRQGVPQRKIHHRCTHDSSSFSSSFSPKAPPGSFILMLSSTFWSGGATFEGSLSENGAGEPVETLYVSYSPILAPCSR